MNNDVKAILAVSAAALVAAAFAEPIKLPPCGVLVGNAIYNSGYGFPKESGPVITQWTSYSKSPYELTELTAKENQGNFIQYWWADTGDFNFDWPLSKARYMALEDVGVDIPKPDWQNMKNLRTSEFPAFAEHRDRAGAGMLKCIRRCEELGLHSALLYLPPDPNPKYVKGFAGCPRYLGYDFGERFSFRFDSEQATMKTARLDTIAEAFTNQVAAHVRESREKGYGRISATSSNFHMDYEVIAGLDYTLFEDFTAELNSMTALSRGLMRQHGLELWGSHIADEHYQWLPWTNPHRKETLRAAMTLKYMSGAKIIVNESGAWDNQTTMGSAPLHRTPRLPWPWPSPVEITEELIRPYALEAEKTMRLIDDTSDFCRHYRKVMSDFYDFVKAHPEPAGQPETTIAVAKGNYDLCNINDGRFTARYPIAGLLDFAERDVRWFNSDPERGWQTAFDVFWPQPKGIFGTDDANRTFSGTPYGQVDIVSFAFDQPSADFLLKNYRLLLFAGWNTCSEKQYRTLCDYVEGGGTLFISVPQLSTDVTRNYSNYTAEDLVNKGDFSRLCGLRVRGRGPRFYWITGTSWDGQNELGLDFHHRYGIFLAPLADVELTDPKAVTTLAIDHESQRPVLIKAKRGKGTVYMMTTWYYPGYFLFDRGPGARSGEDFMSHVWRRLAKAARGSVYVTERGSDEPGADCAHVAVSHFPSNGMTMLFNIDFQRSHTVDLHRGEKVETVTLGPQEWKGIPR